MGHFGSHFDLLLETFGTEEDNPHLHILHHTLLNSGIIPLNSFFAFPSEVYRNSNEFTTGPESQSYRLPFSPL